MLMRFRCRPVYLATLGVQCSTLEYPKEEYLQSSGLHLATPLCQENFTNDLESLLDFSETPQDHDVRNPGPDFLSVFLLRL